MKSHKFDGVSFFSGIVITAIGLLFLIPDTPSEIFEALGGLGSWFWPIALLVIGVAVLIPVFFPKRGDEERQSISGTAS